MRLKNIPWCSLYPKVGARTFKKIHCKILSLLEMVTIFMDEKFLDVNRFSWKLGRNFNPYCYTSKLIWISWDKLFKDLKLNRFISASYRIDSYALYFLNCVRPSLKNADYKLVKRINNTFLKIFPLIVFGLNWRKLIVMFVVPVEVFV